MENSLGNTIEEIKDLTQELMTKFDLSVDEDNLGLVQKPFFYLSILEEIFGIDNIFFTDEIRERFLLLSEAEQLDFIINFLTERVLNQQIEDLTGSEIVSGNLEHIRKFLQIFAFLSSQKSEFDDGKPEIIPEEDSKYENQNTYNTKSDVNRNETPMKGSPRRLTPEMVSRIDEEHSSKLSPDLANLPESVLKENKNYSNVPNKKSVFKPKTAQVKTHSELVEGDEEPDAQTQSKISKIEQDIEDYLNGNSRTKSSLKSKRKWTNSSRKSRKKSKVKTEMDQSQEQRLAPRFDKKTSEGSAKSNRLSIFKRFGASKRRSSKAKSKKKVRIVEEHTQCDSSAQDELNPLVIRRNWTPRRNGRLIRQSNELGNRARQPGGHAGPEEPHAVHEHAERPGALGHSAGPRGPPEEPETRGEDQAVHEEKNGRGAAA